MRLICKCYTNKVQNCWRYGVWKEWKCQLSKVEYRAVIKFLNLNRMEATGLWRCENCLWWKCPSFSTIKTIKRQLKCGRIFCQEGSVFWDYKGVNFTDYLADGQSMTVTYYRCLLEKIRNVLNVRRLGILTKVVHLLFDNAPVHKAHEIMNLVQSLGYCY